jgi:hypothetical protein
MSIDALLQLFTISRHASAWRLFCFTRNASPFFELALVLMCLDHVGPDHRKRESRHRRRANWLRNRGNCSSPERKDRRVSAWLCGIYLHFCIGDRHVVLCNHTARRADEKLSVFVELERQVLTVTFYLESINR